MSVRARHSWLALRRVLVQALESGVRGLVNARRTAAALQTV